MDTQELLQDTKLITSLHAEKKFRIPGTLHPLAIHLRGMVLVKHKYSLNFAFWVVQVLWNLFALNVSMAVIITCFILFILNVSYILIIW